MKGVQAALILCGGFGTRLRPLTCFRPKPLIPFLNEPLIVRLIRKVVSEGVRKIVLATGFGSEIIEREVKKHGLNTEVIFSVEDKPLGTGGAIKNASKHLEKYERFFVINADVVCEVRLGEVCKQHFKEKPLATIVLKQVEDVSGLGVAALKGGKIERFVEKPRPGEAPSNWINAGIYLLEKQVLEMIPRRENELSLERDIFPKIAEEGEMYAYLYSDIWFDIGTIEKYIAATRSYLDRFLKTGFINLPTNIDLHKVKIIQPVMFGRNVIVENKVEIGPHTVIGDQVRIESGVKIRESIIFNDVKFGENSTICNSIVASNCVIGREANINRSVIADWVEVSDRLKVEETSIFHGKKVYRPLLNEVFY